jgi:glutamine synthetase
MLINLKPDVVRRQWEFQVGPSVGIAASDQIWVARYILEVRRFAASSCSALTLHIDE